MDSATFYHLKAVQCRRLAAAISAREGDPAIQTLLNMAAEFEAKAEEIMGNVPAPVGPQWWLQHRGERQHR
jgi:hypothetical protein